LEDAISIGMNHVIFTGLDHDGEKQYIVSIPLQKAMDVDGDVLLAFEMNGEELPINHGFPLRVIVPGNSRMISIHYANYLGICGARSVKWLKSIHVGREESQSEWQQKDYKVFSPNIDASTVDWTTAPSIQNMPVQSAIAQPT
jgi:sulfite oxidase